MPWWSWVLIWSGLVVALLVMLVLFGIVLFRKLMVLATAVGDLGERVSGDRSEIDQLIPAGPTVPAIFQSRDRLAQDAADRRFGRLHERQLRRDRAIHQGKLFRTISASPKDSSHAQ